MFRYVLQIKADQLLEAYENFPQGFEIVESSPEGDMKIAVYSENGDEKFPFHLVRKEEVKTKDWKEYYKPIFVGRNVVIVPPWEVANSSFAGKDLVVINPGKAFGTGLHETTQLCLELMEELDVKGKRILDVGSGSGILSIYALKKGAEKVDAVDIDPLAVEETIENAKLNKVEDRLEAYQGGPSVLKGTYDLVLANLEIHIFRSVLKDITPKIGEKAIFSGLFKAKELIEMLRMMEKENLKPKKVIEKNDWYAILAERV